MTRSALSLFLVQRILKGFLPYVPPTWRGAFYSFLIERRRSTWGARVRHLSFGLCLKRSADEQCNEAAAYRFINSLDGTRTPHLIDAVMFRGISFMLISWVEGCPLIDVFDHLTEEDKKRIVQELRCQIGGMRQQTTVKGRVISNVAGGPFSDHRIPWAEATTYSDHSAFAKQIWTNLNMNRIDTLRPILISLIEREHVDIVFTHGDLICKNIMLPISLDHWRKSGEQVIIIDWETAGWMPFYWEALKSTWMEFEHHTEFTQMIREVFPECDIELDADWRWRSESGVAIV
jgi:aminoglycoside phosphotransferase (APT) family kinase protein